MGDEKVKWVGNQQPSRRKADFHIWHEKSPDKGQAGWAEIYFKIWIELYISFSQFKSPARDFRGFGIEATCYGLQARNMFNINHLNNALWPKYIFSNFKTVSLLVRENILSQKLPLSEHTSSTVYFLHFLEYMEFYKRHPNNRSKKRRDHCFFLNLHCISLLEGLDIGTGGKVRMCVQRKCFPQSDY